MAAYKGLERWRNVWCMTGSDWLRMKKPLPIRPMVVGVASRTKPWEWKPSSQADIPVEALILWCSPSILQICWPCRSHSSPANGSAPTFRTHGHTPTFRTRGYAPTFRTHGHMPQHSGPMAIYRTHGHTPTFRTRGHTATFRTRGHTPTFMTRGHTPNIQDPWHSS